MDYKLKALLTLLVSLSSPLLANSAAATAAPEGGQKPAAEGIVDAGATNAPRLEIRKYRFFHDVKLQRERLVLEFDRRDFYHEAKPRVSFEALSSQEILVKVENAILMGAIPESLINDSYAHQSQYMGPITMDDRSLGSGLAMKVKLKDFDLAYKAEWLTSPSRLVVDIYPKTGPSAKSLAARPGRVRQPKSLDIERKSHILGVGDFMCFPAKAKVNLAVVFQASKKQEEELQKFRVNIDGSSVGLVTQMDKESIVCYPKDAQVKAALSFQITDNEHGENAGQTAVAPAAASLFNFANTSTPPAPSTATAPPAPSAPVTQGSDADLDPGPVGGGEAHSAPSASPASLLPPLGN